MNSEVQNLFKANNKSTRTTWLMLFWCRHLQLQRCGYFGPSSACTLEFFLEFNRQKLKVSTELEIHLWNFGQIYFDYFALIWPGYFRIFY